MYVCENYRVLKIGAGLNVKKAILVELAKRPLEVVILIDEHGKKYFRYWQPKGNKHWYKCNLHGQKCGTSIRLSEDKKTVIFIFGNTTRVKYICSFQTVCLCGIKRFVDFSNWLE